MGEKVHRSRAATGAFDRRDKERSEAGGGKEKLEWNGMPSCVVEDDARQKRGGGSEGIGKMQAAAAGRPSGIKELVGSVVSRVPSKFIRPQFRRPLIVPRSLLSRNMEAPPPPGIKELVDSGLTHVPSKYTYPDSRRPLPSSPARPDLSIPIVDLAPLSSPGDGRLLTLHHIALACRDWGFFQIVNHGVPLPLLDRALSAVDQYFNLPAEERRRYYLDDPRNKRVASANWKETIKCTADESSAPAFLREVALEFEEEVKRLALTLYAAIIESLGVTPDMDKAKEHVANANMLMHYYPPCPDPSLTFGLSVHTDAGFFTILLQDQVGGLEVLKDGEWVPCKPVPNSFTINIADQMEILTNGRYKSVLHRVVTNPEKQRISIPCFLAPPLDGRVGPLPELIDEDNPAVYKEVVFREYIQHYMKVRIADSAISGTDFAKLEPLAT